MASNRPINCTVKDSKSGQPLVGVAVEVHLLNAGIVRNPLARGTTDGNGAFSCALALPDDLHLGHVTTQPCLFMRVEDGDGRWAVSKAAFLADGRNGAVELGLGVAGFVGGRVNPASMAEESLPQSSVSTGIMRPTGGNFRQEAGANNVGNFGTGRVGPMLSSMSRTLLKSSPARLIAIHKLHCASELAI